MICFYVSLESLSTLDEPQRRRVGRSHAIDDVFLFAKVGGQNI